MLERTGQDIDPDMINEILDGVRDALASNQPRPKTLADAFKLLKEAQSRKS